MAQEEIITKAPAPTPTQQVSMTPEQSRSAASALWSAMISSAPQQPGAGTSVTSYDHFDKRVRTRMMANMTMKI